MCYKVANTATKQQLESLLDAEFDDPQGRNWEPQNAVSGFAHPQLPACLAAEPHRLQLLRWGLVPHWTRDAVQAAELANQTLNARAETLFEKPAFRTAARHNRCVIPVTGFFEWQTVGRRKLPYTITPANDSLFLLGGVADTWADPTTGEVHHTFSIVTVPANPLMARIHNTKQRMPLILPRAHVLPWLNPEATPERLVHLLQPFDEANLQAQLLELPEAGAQQTLF